MKELFFIIWILDVCFHFANDVTSFHLVVLNKMKQYIVLSKHTGWKLYTTYWTRILVYIHVLCTCRSCIQRQTNVVIRPGVWYGCGLWRHVYTDMGDGQETRDRYDQIANVYCMDRNKETVCIYWLSRIQGQKLHEERLAFIVTCRLLWKVNELVIHAARACGVKIKNEKLRDNKSCS